MIQIYFLHYVDVFSGAWMHAQTGMPSDTELDLWKPAH